MENLIEKIIPPKLVKNKKLLLYAGGGLVVLIGGYALFRGRQQSVTYGAAAAEPVEDTADSSDDGAGSVSEEEILKRLEELTKNQDDLAGNLGTLGGYLSELMESQAEGYYQQVQQYEPYPEFEVITPPSVLQQQVDLLMDTPSFTFSPRDYTEAQVGVMAGWAADEQAALSMGYAGTSKNPVGAGANDLIVEYHPTGHVSFRPSGSTKTPTPSTAASGAAGDIARATSKSSQSKARSSVSKVTGKSGSIESQLSGQSSSQKLATLKKAGLIN